LKIPTNVENLFYGQPLAKYGCYSPGSPHSFGGQLKEEKGENDEQDFELFQGHSLLLVLSVIYIFEKYKPITT